MSHIQGVEWAHSAENLGGIKYRVLVKRGTDGAGTYHFYLEKLIVVVDAVLK